MEKMVRTMMKMVVKMEKMVIKMVRTMMKMVVKMEKMEKNRLHW